MSATLRALWPWIRPHRRTLLLGLSALVLKDILGAMVPLFLKEGIDSITSGAGLRRVLWFAAALLVLTAVKGVFQYWMRVLVVGVSRDVECDVRNHLWEKLVELDSGFYSRQRTGDIMSRATSDLGAVRMMVGPAVMYISETAITYVVALTVMLWVDWRLTLWALAPAPAASLAVALFGNRLHRQSRRIQALVADVSSRVQESLAGVRVLRAYAQETAVQSRFNAQAEDLAAANLGLGLTQGLFMPVLELLMGLSAVTVLWVGGQRLLAGQMTIGGFLMFNFYMGLLTWPTIAIGYVASLVQRGAASWIRLQTLLDEKPWIAAPPLPRPLPEPLQGAVELHDVTVEFGAARALDGVSLRIEPGSTVAVIGHTGGGKTTLVNLIPRLIDPTHGRVLMDGIDVRDADPRLLRRQIGFVPQETFLFSGTLAGNIALGVSGASRDEILAAAETAGLGPDLSVLPAGLDTRLGERGITLSGGQKQRVAIARAMLRNPRVLVLDDAFASVDTVTEERILANLAAFLRGRTTILISHRVSTVRHAGRIVVLERGRLVEQGTHDQLIAAGGYYAAMAEKQALEAELERI